MPIKLDFSTGSPVCKDPSLIDRSLGMLGFNVDQLRCREILADGRATFERGISLYKRGHYDEAIEAFSKVIDIMPEATAPYFNRAKIYENKEEYTKAINDLSKMISLEPNKPDGYARRGKILLKMNDSKGAIADFSTALKISPNHEEALTGRGLANLSFGTWNSQAALDDLQQAVKLYPRSAPAHMHLAYCYQLSGMYGVAEYHRAIARNLDR